MRRLWFRILYALRLKRRPVITYLNVLADDGKWRENLDRAQMAINEMAAYSALSAMWPPPDFKTLAKSDHGWQPLRIVDSLSEIHIGDIKPGGHIHFALRDGQRLDHIGITRLEDDE